MKRRNRFVGIVLATVLALTLFLSTALAVAAVEVELEVGVYDNVFNLENKDTEWAIIGEAADIVAVGHNIGAQFGYNDAGSTFDFGLIAEGLAISTDYSLIYYADTEDRFVDWGGVVAEGVGIVIMAGTSDSAGALVMSGTETLSIDLPSLPDANAYFYDYTLVPDGYDDAVGAKIWLIPTSVLTGGIMPVATWAPDDTWLFETQLVNWDGPATEIAMVAITVAPDALDFGLLTPGQVALEDLTITNTGFVSADISATATGAISGMTLTLDSLTVSVWETTIVPDADEVIPVGIIAPAIPAAYTGTLTFIATATP